MSSKAIASLSMGSVLINLLKAAAGCAAIEFVGLLGNIEAAAQAGEQRLLQGQVAAERVDGSDAQLRGKFEQIPAQRLRTLQGAAGERVVGSGSRKLIENAVAHFCGSGVGEGDGDHLAGLIDFGKQAEESSASKVVLPEPAGACTRMERVGSRARSRWA